MRAVAMKYWQGICAAASVTKNAYDVLDPRFATGEFDVEIMATSRPEMSGRFWSFVKEADAKKEAQQHDEEQVVIDQQGEQAKAIASQAVEALKKSATDFEQSSVEGLLQKLKEAYLLQIKAYDVALRRITPDVIARLDEAWVQKAERAHQREAMAKDTCALLLDESSFSGAPTWRSAAVGKDIIFIFDSSIADVSSADLKRALTMVGPSGVVLIIISRPESDDINKVPAAEFQLLKEINLHQVIPVG